VLCNCDRLEWIACLLLLCNDVKGHDPRILNVFPGTLRLRHDLFKLMYWCLIIQDLETNMTCEIKGTASFYRGHKDVTSLIITQVYHQGINKCHSSMEQRYWSYIPFYFILLYFQNDSLHPHQCCWRMSWPFHTFTWPLGETLLSRQSFQNHIISLLEPSLHSLHPITGPSEKYYSI
jgi:hypothetical protein